MRVEWSGVEYSRVEWSGVELSRVESSIGVEWSASRSSSPVGCQRGESTRVEWSRVEWSRVEMSRISRLSSRSRVKWMPSRLESTRVEVIRVETSRVSRVESSQWSRIRSSGVELSGF